ncbi:MAG: hypothetical protein KAI67_04930 [Candidatus Pacebacteria bacterium]|nr:hypothetical protein [Candidatus Paceibacterota bacterium]
MKQKIVKVLNSVLILLVAVFSVGYFAGVGAEKVSAEAPSGFTSQTYEDSDGDGMVDQVVIVIDGAVTVCVVIDAEVETDWTYVGNDIGGSLSLTDENHTCDIDTATATATVTLKITDANASTTGHTLAPTIAYINAGDAGSIANDTEVLGTVEVVDITDGAAPIAISSTYKDTDSDDIVDRIDVTYSEIIGSSTFTEGEWSFPINPHFLAVSAGTFSTTDVLIVITDAPTDSMVLDETTVKYTAGTGIVDGVGNYAVDAELPVSADEDEDEDENEDENIIFPGPATPNPNSGVTLYRMQGQHRVYVIKNKKKHWIKTAREFEDNGYKWDEIQEISAELLEEYPEAETLVTELLRAIGDHKVYKLEGGKKHWIETAGEFNAAGYSWDEIQEVSAETLASYQNVVLSGLLRAVGSHKVYSIENGKKRWIKTAREFKAAGHSWEDVEEVLVEDLDDYPDSE